MSTKKLVSFFVFFFLPLLTACTGLEGFIDFTCEGRGTWRAGEGGITVTCIPIEAGLYDAPVDSTVEDAAVEASPDAQEDAGLTDAGTDATIQEDAGTDADAALQEDSSADASDSSVTDAGLDASGDDGSCGTCANYTLLSGQNALAGWAPFPAGQMWPIAVDGGVFFSTNPQRVGYTGALTTMPAGNAELNTTVTISTATTNSWWQGVYFDVFQNKTFTDGQYDLAIWVRSSNDLSRGYRIQLSTRMHDVALVSYPDGGYVRSVTVPAISLNVPIAVRIRTVADEMVVSINNQNAFSVRDPNLLGAPSTIAFALNQGARFDVSHATYEVLPAAPVAPAVDHQPNFRLRNWFDNRPFIFDGDEPVVQVVTPDAPYQNAAKLTPGYRPQLSWTGWWDIEAQGGYPAGRSRNNPATVTGGGATINVAWTAQQIPNNAFKTTTNMVVSWDAVRASYVYSFTSELEVLATSFNFYYAIDFEHQAPLHPFEWKWLVAKRLDGLFYRRPVDSIDPGPMRDVQTNGGMRMWYGQWYGDSPYVPATYYSTPNPLAKKTSVSICAAYSDSAYSFLPEILPQGTKIQTSYKYVGLPRTEATAIFDQSVLFTNPLIDPTNHYVFAEWPTQTFSQTLPTSEPYAFGRIPYETSHNMRLTYEAEPGGGLRMVPASYAAANLPMPDPLAAGRYLISGISRTQGVVGPGGKVEVKAANVNVGHYVGNSQSDWIPFSFSITTNSVAPTFNLGFANNGTGVVSFRDVNVRLMTSGEADVPPNTTEPASFSVLSGAVADYRMTEGTGFFVNDNAKNYGLLGLANASWVTDQGPALRLGPPATTPTYARGSLVDFGYITGATYPQYTNQPFAVAGPTGGSRIYNAFTAVAWVKPDATQPGSTARVFGIGGRSIGLRLVGGSAPYKLSAQWNLGDVAVTPSAIVPANQWSQVAVTGENDGNGKLRMRVFLNGVQVAEGVQNAVTVPINTWVNFHLGLELYYLHFDFYRGLYGHVAVYNRALSVADLSLVER